jgi:hypothetical protein
VVPTALRGDGVNGALAIGTDCPRVGTGEPSQHQPAQSPKVTPLTLISRKSCLVGILVVAYFVTTAQLMPSVAHAQADPRVQKSMELLKSMTAKLGAPKVEGKESVVVKMLPRCISALPR